MEKIPIKNTLTFSELCNASYDLVEPFVLQCKDDSFLCQCVLRHLPGKRLTCVSEYNGQKVLLKLFYAPNKRHVRHAQADKQGSEKLQRANLSTPKTVVAKIKLSNAFSFVAYEYIEDASSLQQLLQKANDAEKIELYTALTTLLVTIHQSGLWYKDLHFDNFIINKDRWYVIDGSAVQGDVGRALPQETRLQNLGLLLAQIKSNQTNFLQQIQTTYLSLCGWDKSVIGNVFLEQRRHHETNFLKRTMRSCSDFICRQNFKQKIVFERTPAGKDAEQFLLSAMTTAQEPLAYLKQGNSSTLMKVELQQHEFVLKRYNIKSKWHGLRRAFRKSRAANTWQFGHLCQLHGIATPKPIAFAEKRLGWIRHEAYILYPYHTGVPLDKFIAMHVNEEGIWQPVLQQTMALLNQLAIAKLVHHDLKASNFLVTDIGIQLLDLDAMQRTISMQRWQHLWQKDKLRFLANFSEHDRIRAYCSELFEQVNL